MKRTFWLGFFALFAMRSFCGASSDGLTIKWGDAIDLGPGGYARVHRLADGRCMAAYANGGALVARFAAPGDLRAWSRPVVVARGFTATNGTETGGVSLANAEFAQLETGRIIYACNLRPDGWRHDIHPCAIAISTSDDAGRTWSPLKVLYRAEVSLPVDGVPHGCYEPFVLPLKGNAAQIYFADESPYVEAKCAWQNISLIETADGGESWNTYFDTAGSKENLDEARFAAKWFKPFGMEIWNIESWLLNFRLRAPVT